MKRIDVLRRAAERMNGSNDRDELLRLIIEELDYLHTETEANTKLREDIRRSLE